MIYFRPPQLRISQMSILVAIAVKGPVLAVDVCKRLCLDKSTLSRDLERLFERGLVRATPDDQRSKHLEVTASGRALIQQVGPASSTRRNRLAESWERP